MNFSAFEAIRKTSLTHYSPWPQTHPCGHVRAYWPEDKSSYRWGLHAGLVKMQELPKL